MLTDDNPRHENARSIRHQLLKAVRVRLKLRIELKVTTAIQKARLDDIVIIAGKGHEYR